MKKLFLSLIILLAGINYLLAQTNPISSTQNIEIDYSNPREYEIGGITIEGVKFLDKNVLIMLSGLTVGDKIAVPGDKISDALRKLWEQGLFADLKIKVKSIQGELIFLEIEAEERPRLSKFTFKGAKKSEIDDLRESIAIIKGQVLTQNIVTTARTKITNYFYNKGYFNVQVNMISKPDSALPNNVVLYMNIDKGKKVKIQNIEFSGNNGMSDSKLRKAMKETKKKRIYGLFKQSKFIEDNYEADKKNIIAAYNAKGYRDATITKDSVYRVNDKMVNIRISIEEGRKFYFRNIEWIGNSKYSSKLLSSVLGIEKGDVYDQKLLDERLNMSANGRDISSVYLDNGYLFFSINPVEVLVEGDSIDLEMRIIEGKQARINRVTVVGNTKTNDHVIIRELRTKPGELFSRSDIIRTQRELSQLGYFNPEKMNVVPKPNPADGTVDIEYTVEEKPNDQIELSGGWGAGRIVGTLGVTFNNFSAKKFFKKDAWRPLPAGDGQKLSLRAQSTGIWFWSYNASFTEPWLGGKKPNSLTVSHFHSVQSNGEKKGSENRQSIAVTGGSIGLGRRLKVPDDFFTMYTELTYQHYELNKWPQFIFSSGSSNNFSGKVVISRNSISDPIFPVSGSQTSLTIAATPPYSLFSGKNYNEVTPQEKYKWAEYHKWKFTSAWYLGLTKNLVIYTKVGMGFLGFYNKNIGTAPFERFYLGGSGLFNFQLDGREIIALRGYDDNSLSPTTGAAFINKYTSELRFRVSPNPNAMVYLLGFVEAGNTFSRIDNYNPFNVYKSAGVGVRIFLPMFGMLGLDWGNRFDDVPRLPNMQKSQIHFTIGFNLGEL